MNNSKKISFGIMGCASIAERSVIPSICALGENFHLIAVASRDKKKASIFADKFNCEALEGYQTLLDRRDIDAVYIPLPTGLHKEWVSKALRAGKHVFVEKSLAMNSREAKKYVSLARKKKLVILEDFMFLYHSQHAFVFECIADGFIGELRQFRSSFGFPPLDKKNFRYSKNLGGGSLFDVGAYTLRATSLFLGPKVRVLASTLHIDKSSGVDVWGSAFLSNGALSSQVSFGFDNFYQCNYELWGDKGKITVSRAFTSPPDYEPKIILEQQGSQDVVLLPCDDHFKNILIRFYELTKSFRARELAYEEILKQATLIESVRSRALLS